MLLEVLSRYLSDVEGEVRKLKGAYVERYEEELLINFAESVQIKRKILTQAQ